MVHLHGRHTGQGGAVWGHPMNSRKISTLVAAAVVTTTLVSSIAHAQIRYVDDDAPLLGDGLSWDTAYRFLQDALAEAAGNPAIDEIRVAQGIYKPDRDAAFPDGNGDQTATFQLIEAVALRGGYAGLGAPDPDARDAEVFETILSGDLAGDDGPSFENNLENSYHVVTAINTDRTTVIDGFTISGGNATDSGFGGGMYNVSGSPQVIGCTFVANYAQFGGAMNNQNNSSPSVENCIFAGNRAGTGAGMRNDDESNPTIYRCVFNANVADRGGAGIYSERNCNPIVIACEFIGNSALGTDSFSGGGAVHNNFLAHPVFISCSFVDNSAVLGGAMMSRDGIGFGAPNPTIINCTFVGNTAESLGGGMSVLAGGPDVTNCVFWDNSPDQIHSEPGASPTVNYSNVQGGWSGPGSNNINADPMLVNPDNGDVRLSPGSPCIDAGDNTAVPKGITTDLDGNPRFVDDPATDDTGNGDAPIVDMGAYEFQGTPCPWDLNGDNIVNVLDLIELVMSFGPCEDCPADFDDDGFVNVLDLIALIMNFGPCPGTPCVWDVNGDGVVDQADVQAVTSNLGPCDGCPEDINGDGVVNGQDAAAVATHLGPCP